MTQLFCKHAQQVKALCSQIRKLMLLKQGADAQEALGVPANMTFVSCSPEVGDVLGPDVMKSTKVIRRAAMGGWDPAHLLQVLCGQQLAPCVSCT